MGIRKLANESADANNAIVLHESQLGCCGELTTALYQFKGAVTNVTGMTIKDKEGNDLLITWTSVSTPAEIRKAIADALLANGFDPYFDMDYYKGIVVTATEISLIGEAVIVSIVVDGTTEAVTVYGTMAPACEDKGIVALSTDAGLLSYDGAAGTQVGIVGGYATGDTAGLQAALEAAATTQGVPYTNISVTEDLVGGTFSYVITSNLGEKKIAVNAAVLSRVRCYPSFVA